MARYAQDQIEAVRARADLVEIIGAHVRLRRTGRNFVGLCPFHNEKTPSFSVNAERGFFHCFGCGAGGTVFDFVMRVEGLTFPEALHSLARRYGIALPERDATGGPGAGEREALAEVNRTAAEFFAHVLWNTPEGAPGRDYLKGRAIAGETARAFMLGFAPARPANLAAILAKRGMTAAALKTGLVKQEPGRPSYDMFRARLMFPIRDAQGRVLGFGGRVIDQRLPKYINSPESPIYSKARSLYGLHEARQALARDDRALVVEGNIDVIALWQAGFKSTVASCGTALTVEQLRLLARYTRNIIACFDGDAAGRKASLRALEIFLAADLLGRGVFIPAGYDPDTLVRERGAQALEELLASSELLVDYFVREQAAAAGSALSGKARAAERVAEMLRMVRNPFEFDLLARKAAQTLGVAEALLRQAARRPGGAQPSARAAGRDPGRPPAQASPGGDAVSQAEIGLLAIALNFDELRAQLASQAATVEFRDPMVAAMLEDICMSQETRAALEVRIMAGLSDEMRRRLSALMVGPLMVDAESAQKMAADFFAALDRSRRRRQLESERRIAGDSSGDDAARVAAAQNLIALRKQSAEDR